MKREPGVPKAHGTGTWRLRAGLIGVALACLAGCSTDAGRQRTLTERERDSTIAASPLPGAGTVGKAMEVADSAAARNQRALPGNP